MSEVPLKKYLCSEGWNLFEAWSKLVDGVYTDLSLLKNQRSAYRKYFNHTHTCKECQALRRNHGN